jgi:hypothetical protein
MSDDPDAPEAAMDAVKSRRRGEANMRGPRGRPRVRRGAEGIPVPGADGRWRLTVVEGETS